ncbi:hypothetical protein [Methylacidimicrobium sp. AP8]|uniref:DUF6941 family protein n=1 Tax=Methylacidimicrobium sp. AP8 TaxID=2730359 RepID=UPI0019223DA5|nr:hypothetical protein [Methylacidimicrobium sp. AP8]
MDQEPVLCPAILLSDLVVREKATDKLTLVNTFGQLRLPKFPFPTPLFFITVWLTHLRGRVGQLDIAARIEDPKSGHVLASASGQIQFPAEAPPFDEQAVLDLPIPMPPFLVPQAAVYSVVILVNNEKVGERPLPIVSPAPETGGAGFRPLIPESG